MSNEERSRYAEYISKGIRFALKETGKKFFPESTKIVVFNTYSPLVSFDQLLGYDIIVTKIPSSYEFCLAFNSDEEANYDLLKAFLEYLDLYSMDDGE